jgi:hypothetical protein
VRAAADVARPAGHAAVTAGAYAQQVLKAGGQGEPGQTGALLLRVWLEGDSCDPRLRIRIISRQDMTGDTEDVASASTIEEALAHVRDWLERFVMSGW